MKLPKVYEPDQYENDIYSLWEKSEAFVPKDRGGKSTYSIVVPPPNANGNLHLGHALTLGIEDAAIRYHRMKGDKTLFVPGADHAGFETQVVYEKQLATEGKSRFDFTREELYQQVWDFVALNKTNYESQFRRLGASVDWQHYTYTLDEKIVKRAHATFKKMWDEELIYRGERLVNFCTFHGTGFADIEVEHKEEQGHLWYIRYPLTDGSGAITVATTRPETMLGDTAVAVDPKDKRYKQFLGKTVKLPLTQREIPILADDMVDQEFGTGAVKITPAHDPNDYDVAQRHDLPMITVISHEGKMTHEVPEPYRGLGVKEAREAVVKDLADLELLEKTEDYSHSVGHCYKCGTIIQPLLREQWFISMQPLAKPAIQALREDKIAFYPEAKKAQLITYYKSLRDWNISRQIAWGIPIPAFQSVDDPEDWIYDERVDQEIIEVDGKTYHRDPDVFDTWFSSSSWPYATLDFPDGQDYKDFYPLSLMETGADILFPWVSRMIIFGLYNTGKVPFEKVYLHGLIQDEHGAKMSKSKGNVIDPMTKLDEFGSDAFRMGIILDESPAKNRPYDQSKIVGARNFCNKLWNVARFIEDKLDSKENSGKLGQKANPKAETPADAWMLRKLQHTTELVTGYMENYRFSEASEAVYHLLWDDFADWYIEASKTSLNASVLVYGLETILKLAHPFAPFVTETIWQTLKATDDTSLLITSPWPTGQGADDKQADVFEEIKNMVSEIRYIKSALKLQGKLTMYHTGDEFITEHTALLKSLARLAEVKEVRDGHGLHLTSTKHVAWLDVDQETANHFAAELKAKIEDQQKQIKNLEARLANKAYVDKAPKQLVDQTKQQLEEAKASLQKTRQEHDRFAA
ncbi:MAG TPA: valine--tRNA ligase [Candidatus Limnocylindria bacterium]|nr:valine--tRNA ligase [Candidatus Limnocylindria bacterium]